MTLAKIDSFQGQYRFLSNFYPAPVEFQGLEYPTNEHAYQASKCLNQRFRHFIASEEDLSAAGAKRLGRALSTGKLVRVDKNWVERDDWFSVNLDIMFVLNFEKFRRHDDLRELLLETGEAELIEGNHWGDVFWGVCNGVGENHLGKILMKVRDGLRFLWKASSDVI
jgi:ribA/ribD-fused uncharacterized protein